MTSRPVNGATSSRSSASQLSSSISRKAGGELSKSASVSVNSESEDDEQQDIPMNAQRRADAAHQMPEMDALPGSQLSKVSSKVPRAKSIQQKTSDLVLGELMRAVTRNER